MLSSCVCVRVCVCVCVGVRVGVGVQLFAAASSLWNELCSTHPVLHLSPSPTCLSLRPSESELVSSLPYRLGPKMSPMRLLLMLAPVSHPSQLCVQSLRARFWICWRHLCLNVVSIPALSSCLGEAKHQILRAEGAKHDRREERKMTNEMKKREREILDIFL